MTTGKVLQFYGIVYHTCRFEYPPNEPNYEHISDNLFGGTLYASMLHRLLDTYALMYTVIYIYLCISVFENTKMYLYRILWLGCTSLSMIKNIIYKIIVLQTDHDFENSSVTTFLMKLGVENGKKINFKIGITYI